MNRLANESVKDVRSIVAMSVMALVLMIGSVRPAWAQTNAPTGSTTDPVVIAAAPAGQAQDPLTVQDWIKRSHMFGDWGGHRTTMADRGLKFDASWTQFFASTPLQPPFGDRRDWDYGGKLDFKATADLGQSLGWSGVSVTSHVEFRYGDTKLLAGGTFLPTNAALLFPKADGNAIQVSSLYVSKLIGTSTVVHAGRFNTVDMYETPFSGGQGTDKFMNMAFVAPPLIARTTPPVVEGVFFMALKEGEPLVTVGLIESTQDGFFQNGATVLGTVRLPIRPFEAPGHYYARGTVSSIEATSLDQSIFVVIPTPLIESEVPLEKVKNAWTLDFTFDQYLWWDPATKTGYGVFGSFGVSDANPSVVDAFVHLGVGGNSPIPGRRTDNFGVGYYLAGVSNTLRESFAPVLRLRNENGFEAFYNIAVTGWSKIAADVQVIDPFAVGSKTRTFFSVRWKLIF